MADTSRARSKVVVIAEDEKPVQDLIRTCLEMDGWEVHAAGDGETAVALVAEHDPVLVVLDVMMPGTDGRTACRRIREADGGSDQRVVVMLTALNEEGDIVEGVMSGADDYITKPFDASDLAPRCERFVEAAGWTLAG